MSLHQKNCLGAAVCAVGLVFAIAGYGGILGGIGFFLIVAGLVLSAVLLRCPKCGAWLGRRPGDYCKDCGAKIEWKKGSKA